MKWYLDSLGKPTGGYGHLQRPQDVGKTVTRELAEQWLVEDMRSAEDAADKQVGFLPFYTQELRNVLVSVNFQLGTAWNTKFRATWSHLLKGDFDLAADEVENSLWAKQTPVRVRDFQKALYRTQLIYDLYRKG